MNVIWSDRANTDLRQIFERREELSPESATRLVDAITTRTHQLAAFPDSGRMMPEFENRYLRELIEGDYRIIYERFPDRVEIVSVAHGKQSFLSPD